MITFAPAFARSMQASRPIPLDPPVTRAILPDKSMFISLPLKLFLMNYPTAKLRGIKSVIPVRPVIPTCSESFLKKDSRQAGMTKMTKTIETPKQSFEEFF
jgi:hypothetical protein